MNRAATRARIGALTVVGTAIVLPLVIFVLGPNMPPGNRTTGASSQVTDNTVLLVVMTPFTVFILVYLGYAIATLPRAARRGAARRPADPRAHAVADRLARRHERRGAVPRDLRDRRALRLERLGRRQRPEADREAERRRCCRSR